METVVNKILIAATVVTTAQIGIEEWADLRTTKVFDGRSTLDDIITWARTLDKSSNINSIKFSDVV